MKRILYLSFYFEPDLCAGSFRNSPLAKELARQLEGKVLIDVITTMPNRYSSYSADCSKSEKAGNLHIERILLPIHKNGFIDQLNAFRHYYFSVKKIIALNKYDLVFASSSRLFTAFLGYRIAKRHKLPLYLDIRDIFTDTLNDVLSNNIVKIALLPVLRQFEKKVFNYAKHINLISAGFKSYFEKYDNPNYSYFTNGIDNEFIHESTYEELLPITPIIITYAGNIGEGQGLHKIIPEAANLLGENYVFKIIGDGGARLLLENEINRLSLKNVIIEKPISRIDLIEAYKHSHYLLIHLNDYAAFEKVLPSKVFELGAFPRPIIAGVNGYSRLFIEQNLTDYILFEPTNSTELVSKIKNYKYNIPKRNLFIQQFSRTNINIKMAESIIFYL
jgi:hypothetical protein